MISGFPPRLEWSIYSPTREMQSEELNPKQGCATAFGWFVSALLGAVFALFSSVMVIPLVFGVQKRDSASVWGLSGVADLVVGFLSLPAFLVAHAIAFAFSNSEGSTTSWRGARSVMVGLLVFWVVIVIVWQHQGGGKVLRSQ